MCSRTRGGSLLVACLSLALACGGESRNSLPAVATSIEPACANNVTAAPVVVHGTMPVKPVVSMSGSTESTLETGYRLWLGDVELADVRWVDASTVSATVPPGIAAGVYTLAVESPFGERSTLEGAFRVANGPCDPTGARLVTTAEALPTQLAVGERVVVTATVTNDGDATATGVTTAVSAPPGFTVFTRATDALDIAPGQARTFTWTYTANAGAGHGTFAVTAAGVDSLHGQSVSARLSTTNDVAVTYSVGGTVVNLPNGGGLVLQLNGSNDRTIAANGAFTFASPVASGTDYNATILTQPTGHTCRVVGGTGTVTTASVTSVQVNCDPNSMTLSAATSGSGALRCNNVACATTYPYGTFVNVTAVPQTGWSFTSWSGDCTGAQGCSLTMDRDHTVTATFTLNTYAITYSPTVNGSVSGPASVQHGSGATFTATPATGYSVGTWSGCTAPAGSATCSVASVTGPLTVSTTFVANSYSVTYPATANGTVTGPATVAYGTGATFTANPSTGYSVGTWSGCTAADGSSTCTVSAVTGPLTVSATFVATTYPVTYTATTNGTVTGPANVTYGTSATFTATPNTGYTVGTWSGCTAPAGSTTCTVPSATGALTISATFLANGFPVTYPATSGGSVTGPSTVTYGSSATFTATPSTGYSVGTWSGCTAAPGSTTCTVSPVTGPLTISATFLPNTYSVTYPATSNGTVTGPSTVTYGTSATFTASPNTGYSVGAWSGCTAAAGSTTCTVASPTGALTISATFVASGYPVTYSATVGGVVTGPSTVTFGSSATFTATPSTGYSVGTWSGCTAAPGSTTCTVSPVTGPLTISATFLPNTYSVTYPATSNGTVTGPSTVTYGTSATFTASPNTGYSVGTWSGCTAPAGSTTCTVSSVTGALTISATFVANGYPVTYPATVGGTVTGPSTVTYGSSATFTAAAATGYVIGSWSGCTAPDGSSTCTVSPVTGPLTISASFIPVYTVGGTVSGLAGGDQVTLQLNGANDLVVHGGGTKTFTFGTPLQTLQDYSVTVLVQPTALTCTVTNGAGQIGTSNVTDVSVQCGP